MRLRFQFGCQGQRRCTERRSSLTGVRVSNLPWDPQSVRWVTGAEKRWREWRAPHLQQGAGAPRTALAGSPRARGSMGPTALDSRRGNLTESWTEWRYSTPGLRPPDAGAPPHTGAESPLQPLASTGPPTPGTPATCASAAQTSCLARSSAARFRAAPSAVALAQACS